MARICSNCGAQLPDIANHCPQCGRAVGQGVGGGVAAAPAPTAAGLADHIAGALAYVTVIPAILFLVLEPYKRNRFIRFHAFQSIFFCFAVAIVVLALTIVGSVLGWIVAALLFVLGPLLALLVLILGVLMMLKAFTGHMWKLPLVGDLAERQAEIT